MTKKLLLTKIPQLNSVVIKQEGGHFFIAAPNSLVIDKNGFMIIITQLLKMGFINSQDLMYADLESRLEKENENNENGSNSNIG